MTIEKATEELRKVNNELSLLMSKKRALQKYVEDENNRLKGESSLISKAWELKNDPNFIKEHGRERTSEEIGRLMNYSRRQVQRFLNKKLG